ncbi:hypothetical protein KR222_005872, partial [Zaprionus bogoriensis]
NQPLNIIIKQLVQCLRKINEPISVNELLQVSKVTARKPNELRQRMKMLLDVAVSFGFVKKCNNHYFASTHAEDVVPLLGIDMDNDPSAIGSIEALFCGYDDSLAVSASESSYSSDTD